MARSPEVPGGFAAESQRGFGGDAKPCLGTPAVLALPLISVWGGKDKNSFDKAASLELFLALGSGSRSAAPASAAPGKAGLALPPLPASRCFP